MTFAASDHSSWTPINLLRIDDEATAGPEWCGMVYRGIRHVFSGEPESAKTLAALIVALDVVRNRGKVIYCDFEMGARAMKARLRELGATDDDLAGFVYLEPEDAPTPEVWRRLITPHIRLAILDAASGAYDAADLDGDKTRDTERFASTFLRPLWKVGVATIVIDHVVKNRQARGKYATGSHRKVGGADVHLGFEMVKPLVRGGVGLAHVYVRKDRHGHLARPRVADLELRSDPETHAIDWTWKPPSAAHDPDEWRPTGQMERVSRFLERQPSAVTKTDIYAAIRGRREILVTAVTFLVRDGYAEERRGNGTSRLLRSVKPYREPVPDVPRRSPDVPDASTTVVPTFPPPIGGDGNGDAEPARFDYLAEAARELGVRS